MFITSLGLHLVLALTCGTQAAVLPREPATLSAPTAISSTTVKNMAYIEQFAAAAYCGENNGGNTHSTNKVVVCDAPCGPCPDVSGNMAPINYKFYEVGPHKMTGFIAIDNVNKLVVLAYRGSFSLQDDVNSLQSLRMVNWPELKPVCPDCGIADVFHAARNETRDAIDTAFLNAIVNHPGYDAVVTGHSFGAAHAAVAATELRAINNTSTSLYTYAQPRIGNNATSNLINASPRQGGPAYAGTYRLTHLNDPLPNLPPYAAGGSTPTPLCKRPAPYPATANDWTHSSPEFHIKSGDSGIRVKDIEILTGPLNCGGNSGLVVLPVSSEGFCSKANCTANAHYFGCTNCNGGPGN